MFSLGLGMGIIDAASPTRWQLSYLSSTALKATQNGDESLSDALLVM